MRSARGVKVEGEGRDDDISPFCLSDLLITFSYGISQMTLEKRRLWVTILVGNLR